MIWKAGDKLWSSFGQKPMRTIKRVSYPLNQNKYAAIREIASAYAREKQEHLPDYQDDALFGSHRNERTLRDELVRSGYRSPHGVSARMWKLAQKDAYETVKKQWAALAENVRPLVAAHRSGNGLGDSIWTDNQMRYAYWLLSDPRRLAQIVGGEAIIPRHFKIEAGPRKVVGNYLRRVVRRQRGEQPCVKLERAFTLDADMYDIKVSAAGTQILAITSLVPRRRIRIPLKGKTVIRGNIQIVLNNDKQRIEVHYTADIKPVKQQPTTNNYSPQSPLEQPSGREDEPAEVVVAVDAGLSEVFTDEGGNRYGTGLGRLIYDESDRILARNRRRNKLYQLAEKHSRQGRHKKARNIRRFNLGQKKQAAQRRRNQIELERQINTAMNQLLRERQPTILVTEKLDLRGKAKSKKMSRQVSLWPRGILQERTDFKASAAGCRREQVNPAYTSQMCPHCGFVDGKNRSGDRFKCLNCGHEQGADRVAAMNLKARRTDPDITLWTPKERVKIILLDRFAAGHSAQQDEVAVCRLETVKPEAISLSVATGGTGTVTGRTPVATRAVPNSALSTESETTSAMPRG
jgi:putative transposase